MVDISEESKHMFGTDENVLVGLWGFGLVLDSSRGSEIFRKFKNLI